MKSKYLLTVIFILTIILLTSCQKNEPIISAEQPEEINTDLENINQTEAKDLDENSKNEEIKICMRVIAHEGLNLREHPQINSKKIVLMPYDSEVIIIDNEKVKDTIDKKKGNWIKVKYNDKQGWAFDAYLDCIIDRDEIKTGDIINGLEAVVKQDGKEIEFQGKVSLTGELLMNNSFAVLIPDKKYSNILPKFNGGNEIFYFLLKNFREIANEQNLSSNTYNVSVELDGYTIASIIKGNKSIPQYKTKLLSINEIKEKETNKYNGKDIEGYYITEEIQIKDTICGLRVVYISVINDKYDPTYPYYLGSVGFIGEITLKCSYFYCDEDFLVGYSFNVLEEDYNKIPHFKGQETPHFEISNIDEETKEKLGKKGTAKIKVNNFNNYWWPKEITSTAELVEIILVEKEEDF